MHSRTRPAALFFALVAALPSLSLGAPVRIPLVKGLVEVAAVQRPIGDEEQVMTVTDANDKHVDFSVEFRLFDKKPPEIYTRTRRVRRADLAASNRRNIVFQDGDPLTFPGSTMSLLSAKTLAELKSTGKAPMVMGTLAKYGEVGVPSYLDVTSGRKYFRGDLVRVGKANVPLTVQVNGKSTKLLTVQARGTFKVGNDQVAMEVWVLDDPANPMVLRARQDRNFGQVVTINFPVAQPRAATLAKELSAGACRAELSGIYFDFGKATLLSQSAPALRSVAEVMKANASWKLRIEGHTDNVGSAAFNQTLSQRRAAAVGEALSGQYGVAAARFTIAGLGASKPVASNDTLEGRAANRRVELARQCH